MNHSVTPENYFEKRKELVEKNMNPVGIVLRENERQLDEKLIRLKEDFYNSCKGSVPFDMPVLTDERIHKSRLYEFCAKLPKGADLHVHDMAGLPVHLLIDLLYKREDMLINREGYIKHASDGGEIPDGYMLFRDALDTGMLSNEKLRTIWTVSGAGNEKIWDYFERLFKMHSELSKSIDFIKTYYEHTFCYYCEHGVIHIEIHKLLYKDNDICLKQVTAIRDAYYTVKKKYPDLCVSVIGAGFKSRDFSVDFAKECFLKTIYVRDNVKDCSEPEHVSEFVIGFDLVNEEDAGRPLREFAGVLLEAKKAYPDMGLYVHGGESLNAESDNLIDAYLLGAKRVGHGMNLYRYPDLLGRYSESEICLEVCLISNQTLGYTKDIRLHPAMEFLRRGMAVALCSDDPAYQENQTLTDDFFAAITCWNLNIADIKQLAINSIMYSGVDAYQKKKLMQAFDRRWRAFVSEMIEN